MHWMAEQSRLKDKVAIPEAKRGRVIIVRPILWELMVHKTTWTNLRFRKAKVEETPENYIPADSIDFEFGSELLK